MHVRADLVVVYVLRAPTNGPDHEVLQLRRRHDLYMGGTWQFCGGGIEPGEAAAEAAMRELREETGLAPRALSFLSHVETFYIAHADTICHRIGFCAVVAPDDPIELNEEHTAYRWLGRREIRRLVTWPGERTALAEIFREHVRPSLAEPHRRLMPPNRPAGAPV